MGRPYNKKTVEEAVELCNAVACNPNQSNDLEWFAIFLGIRPGSTAVDLAEAAIDGVKDASPMPTCIEDESAMWAEAACLIAEGWQMGDPVAQLQICRVIADENVPEGRAYILSSDDQGGVTGHVERVLRLVTDDQVVSPASTNYTVEETETAVDGPTGVFTRPENAAIQSDPAITEEDIEKSNREAEESAYVSEYGDGE